MLMPEPLRDIRDPGGRVCRGERSSSLLKVLRAKLVGWAGGKVGGRAGLWDAVERGLGRALKRGLAGWAWVAASLGAVNTPTLKAGRRLTRPFPSRRMA